MQKTAHKKSLRKRYFLNLNTLHVNNFTRVLNEDFTAIIDVLRDVTGKLLGFRCES